MKYLKVPKPKKEMNKEIYVLICVSVLIFGVIVAFLILEHFFFDFNINIEPKAVSKEAKEQYNEAPYKYFTFDNVVEICNKTKDNRTDKKKTVECLHQLFVSNVQYENCSNRSNIFNSMATLNRGYGCCRESAEYYKYFLERFDIDYTVNHFPNHEFIVAEIDGDYYRLDFHIMKKI